MLMWYELSRHRSHRIALYKRDSTNASTKGTQLLQDKYTFTHNYLLQKSKLIYKPAFVYFRFWKMITLMYKYYRSVSLRSKNFCKQLYVKLINLKRDFNALIKKRETLEKKFYILLNIIYRLEIIILTV